MNILGYLPSAQFAVIASSVALSGGLIVAANHFTSPARDTPNILASSKLEAGSPGNTNWAQTLQDIQAQNSLYTLPPPPNENAVEELLNAARSQNITETVGRTLLVNLSNAKSQGLGNDIPTQDKLIADAASYIPAGRATAAYTSNDLAIVPETKLSLHRYGNDVAETMAEHTTASYFDTLLAMGNATDTSDPAHLSTLKKIQADYKALAQDLSLLEVPQTLAPLHLQIVNNLARTADSFTEMGAVLSDPLRGLGGIQIYESLIGETARMFTNIAQHLSKNSILFNKNEPGSAWSSLLP